jgi:hypothetical protein
VRVAAYMALRGLFFWRGEQTAVELKAKAELEGLLFAPTVESHGHRFEGASWG